MNLEILVAHYLQFLANTTQRPPQIVPNYSLDLNQFQGVKRALEIAKPEPPKRKRKKRKKWSNEELKLLWTGILQHGNDWKYVAKYLTERNYSQVKDKGRRLLQEKEWISGRKVQIVSDAKQSAKTIAFRVLMEDYVIDKKDIPAVSSTSSTSTSTTQVTPVLAPEEKLIQK